MSQRTNQFNLTTRRYTVAELQQMVESASVEAYTLAVRDRFGDSGITGLAILKFSAGTAEIDTFLLSCRVLGRRIENALIAFLAGRAQSRGAPALLGRYVPTARNAQVANMYPDAGFKADEQGVFHLDLERSFPPSEPLVSVKANSVA